MVRPKLPSQKFTKNHTGKKITKSSRPDRATNSGSGLALAKKIQFSGSALAKWRNFSGGHRQIYGMSPPIAATHRQSPQKRFPPRGRGGGFGGIVRQPPPPSLPEGTGRGFGGRGGFSPFHPKLRKGGGSRRGPLVRAWVKDMSVHAHPHP